MMGDLPRIAGIENLTRRPDHSLLNILHISRC